MELKQGGGGRRTRRLLMKYFFLSQVINQLFIFQKSQWIFFVKREKCAILSVTVWASFPLLYIGYCLFKHHRALAFVPALKRCHTCFMFKVLTKIRHCVRVIQDHNHNRMRNYSGKWVRPIFLEEGNVTLENSLQKHLS